MTIAFDVPTSMRDEHRFFLISGWILAAASVAGFASNLLVGRSSFGLPLVYHVHAVIFLGWVALYLAQTGLVAAGDLRLHRRLGWLAVLWIPLMLMMGLMLVIVSLRARGGTPPRPANDFLFTNSFIVIGFACLAVAALLSRKRTAWHRRLMFCAMVLLASPSVGRIIPPPINGMTAGWAVFFPLLLFPIAGMIADQRRLGRIHPAWWWGIGGIVAPQLLGAIIAFSSLGKAATRAVLDGSPGALLANVP